MYAHIGCELCVQEDDNDEENTQPSRSTSVVNTVITETITTTVEAQCSTAPPSPKLCQPNQSMISIQPCQLITGRGTGKPSSDGRNSTIALGVLSAILFLIMVAVIAGWIVTCFALKKKKAKSTKESSQTRYTHTHTHTSLQQRQSWNMFNFLQVRR